jgi:hypothetical protein
MAVEGDRGDTLAVVGTQGGTQADITTVTLRGLIPVGTAGGVTGIIPVDIGGVLGAMLIQVGGGLIRLSIYIPILMPTPIPIPIPILIPMIFLHRRAP